MHNDHGDGDRERDTSNLQAVSGNFLSDEYINVQSTHLGSDIHTIGDSGHECTNEEHTRTTINRRAIFIYNFTVFTLFGL